MFRKTHTSVILLLFAGCSVGTLDPGRLPVRMTIVQRHSEFVPGSRETVRVSIDDITDGQVLLKILDRRDDPIIQTRSVKAGDIVTFRLGGKQYYLGVLELRNFIVGNDFGVFEIATEPPKIELPPVLEQDQTETAAAPTHP